MTKTPENIIEAVAEVRQTYQNALLSAKMTASDARTLKYTLNHIDAADFYEIAPDVLAAAADAVEVMFDPQTAASLGKPPVIGVDSRLPSRRCVFWLNDPDLGANKNMLLIAMQPPDDDPHPDGAGLVYINGLTPKILPEKLGSYRLGSEEIMLSPKIPPNMRDGIIRLMLEVAAICSFINTPTFTKKAPVGTRQQRAVASRRGGPATHKWHRIVWNIGEEAQATAAASSVSGRRVAMHYTRGHWRRAEEGWKNTSVRGDGKTYQWIDGFWSGHPAFGVIRGVHTPRVSEATP